MKKTWACDLCYRVVPPQNYNRHRNSGPCHVEQDLRIVRSERLVRITRNDAARLATLGVLARDIRTKHLGNFRYHTQPHVTQEIWAAIERAATFASFVGPVEVRPDWFVLAKRLAHEMEPFKTYTQACTSSVSAAGPPSLRSPRTGTP